MNKRAIFYRQVGFDQNGCGEGGQIAVSPVWKGQRKKGKGMKRETTCV